MNTQKIIIGLVGEMASGKGTSACYLQDKYQAADYRFSTILRKILKILHLKINRRNMANLSLSLRQTFGEDILDRSLSKEVEKNNNDIVVIDGIRRQEDMNYLSKLKGFHLIYIEIDPKIAYRRILKRHENSDDEIKSWEEFQKDHQLETEKGIKKLKSQAEFIINNNQSLDDLYKQWDEIIKKIKE